MPGLVRWAGWLIVVGALAFLAPAGHRAEHAGPGIPHPLPSNAGRALGEPLVGGPPGPGGASTLPATVADLALAAARGGPGSTILGAVPASWGSTCLGLAAPGAICGQARIDGWIVTVDVPTAGPLTVHVGAGLARVAGGP